MTHRGPFQPLLFCDSVIHSPSKAPHLSEDFHLDARTGYSRAHNFRGFSFKAQDAVYQKREENQCLLSILTDHEYHKIPLPTCSPDESQKATLSLTLPRPRNVTKLQGTMKPSPSKKRV